MNSEQAQAKLKAFPFDDMDRDAALDECFLLESMGLLIYRETETDAERYEYGESMFELSEKGKAIISAAGKEKTDGN